MPRILGDPDELIEAINRKARNDEHDIRKQSEEKAEQVREEARERARRAREEILENAHEKAEEIRRKRRARASRQQNREHLEEREKLLDQAWSRAEERLRSLSEDKEACEKILKRLALLGVRILGPGKRILTSGEEGYELLTEKRLQSWAREFGKELEGKVHLERAPEPADTWGGIVVTDEKGKRRVDATFPSRLLLAREEIRGDILRKLVGS